ncbi:uncharacterized protein LOC100279367 [Zea mays]|uniref:Uncharacterized protein n=1 Tax=Zea mays TaxID=4577 RepID=B7ZXT6_MAIZE|nr:uncharacterized protein LOC100279367 [Zea mays]ACL52735.1 unknown [Zea mays]|eukprot:NP_001145856.1 uncharacterized protein LOC100279367 [Zea mays]
MATPAPARVLQLQRSLGSPGRSALRSARPSSAPISMAVVLLHGCRRPNPEPCRVRPPLGSWRLASARPYLLAIVYRSAGGCRQPGAPPRAPVAPRSVLPASRAQAALSPSLVACWPATASLALALLPRTLPARCPSPLVWVLLRCSSCTCWPTFGVWLAARPASRAPWRPSSCFPARGVPPARPWMRAPFSPTAHPSVGQSSLVRPRAVLASAGHVGRADFLAAGSSGLCRHRARDFGARPCFPIAPTAVVLCL